MPIVKNVATGKTVAKCGYDDPEEYARCKAMADSDPGLVLVDKGSSASASYSPAPDSPSPTLGEGQGYRHGGEVSYGPESRGTRSRSIRGRRGPRLIKGPR